MRRRTVARFLLLVVLVGATAVAVYVGWTAELAVAGTVAGIAAFVAVGATIAYEVAAGPTYRKRHRDD